jgi:hypothetical protein
MGSQLMNSSRNFFIIQNLQLRLGAGDRLLSPLIRLYHPNPYRVAANVSLETEPYKMERNISKDLAQDAQTFRIERRLRLSLCLLCRSLLGRHGRRMSLSKSNGLRQM